MMGNRQKLDGSAWDAFAHGVRQMYGHKAGAMKWIKRRYSRKARKDAKRGLDEVCKTDHEF